MAKERIKKKKRNNDIFESSSGISEVWCLTGMEAPFPKGIQSVDIYKSIIRRYPWCIVTELGLWQVGGPISNSSSCLPDIYAHTASSLRTWIYICERAKDRRKKRDRERKREVVRRKVAHDRSGTDLWFDLERHESGRPCIRWNDLVSFVVSLTRERYTTPDRNTTGEARKRYVVSVLGPLGFSNGAINNWQQILFCRLHQLINSSSFCTNDTSIRRYFN